MTKDEIAALKRRYNECVEEGTPMWERLEVLAKEMLDDDEPCERCHGDGWDPWNDYLLPCPACGGERC